MLAVNSLHNTFQSINSKVRDAEKRVEKRQKILQDLFCKKINRHAKLDQIQIDVEIAGSMYKKYCQNLAEYCNAYSTWEVKKDIIENQLSYISDTVASLCVAMQKAKGKPRQNFVRCCEQEIGHVTYESIAAELIQEFSSITKRLMSFENTFSSHIKGLLITKRRLFLSLMKKSAWIDEFKYIIQSVSLKQIVESVVWPKFEANVQYSMQVREQFEYLEVEYTLFNIL